MPSQPASHHLRHQPSRDARRLSPELSALTLAPFSLFSRAARKILLELKPDDVAPALAPPVAPWHPLDKTMTPKALPDLDTELISHAFLSCSPRPRGSGPQGLCMCELCLGHSSSKSLGARSLFPCLPRLKWHVCDCTKSMTVTPFSAQQL